MRIGNIMAYPNVCLPFWSSVKTHVCFVVEKLRLFDKELVKNSEDDQVVDVLKLRVVEDSPLGMHSAETV